MLLHPDEAVEALTAVGGVDVAIEAVGREDAFLAALESLAVGGELVVLGGIPVDSQVLVTPRTLLRKQARVTGCIYGWIDPQADLPRFARWCADGTIPVDDLVTREIGLEELPAEFAGERHPGRAHRRALRLARVEERGAQRTGDARRSRPVRDRARRACAGTRAPARRSGGT